MTAVEITSLVTAVAAVAAAWISWLNGRRILDVHVAINSRMTELLNATGAAARANGVVQGRKEEKDRVGES